MDRQMAIEEILVNMEEVLENAKSMPFSDKVLVDREELFDLITDIRLKMQYLRQLHTLPNFGKSLERKICKE